MNKSARIVILTFVLLSSCLRASGQYKRDQVGTLTLPRVVDALEFEQGFLNYTHFLHRYLKHANFDDMAPCQGQDFIARANGQGIDVCSITNKIGLDILIKSAITNYAITRPNCLKTMRFDLTILNQTSPALIVSNIQGAMVDFCLHTDGRRLSYEGYLKQGQKPGLLYRPLASEMRSMFPDLLETVLDLF
jgi:hypothetical protein